MTSKTVTVIAEFELPDGVGYADLVEFFEFELGQRCVLPAKNALSGQDMPPAKSVDVRDW